MSPIDWAVLFVLWAVAMWRLEACYRRIDAAAQWIHEIEHIESDGDVWEPVERDDDEGEEWKSN